MCIQWRQGIWKAVLHTGQARGGDERRDVNVVVTFIPPLRTSKSEARAIFTDLCEYGPGLARLRAAWCGVGRERGRAVHEQGSQACRALILWKTLLHFPILCAYTELGFLLIKNDIILLPQPHPRMCVSVRGVAGALALALHGIDSLWYSRS
jgi:hypothetical protein